MSSRTDRAYDVVAIYVCAMELMSVAARHMESSGDSESLNRLHELQDQTWFAMVDLERRAEISHLKKEFLPARDRLVAQLRESK